MRVSKFKSIKMKKKYRRILIGLSIGYLFLNNSCTKFVQIDPAPDLIESNNVFSNDQTALSSLVGLYHQMTSANLSLTNGGLSVYLGLAADELENQTADQNYDLFYSNALPSDNFIVSNFWGNAYRGIYRANAIIEGVSSSENLTGDLRNMLLGEALFVRAFYYFQLVNLFGDIPLITVTDYQISSQMNRTAKQEVDRQIVDDLLLAKGLLSDNYPTAGKVRPNKLTVTAFLARVYLYLEEWQSASENALAVIESGRYSLGALENAFAIDSEEAIWQLMRDNANTAEAMAFIPLNENAIPSLSLSEDLASSFEESDERKTQWTQVNNADAQTGRFPFKYKVRTNLPVSEYLTVFRLAEQYLINAEANMHLGKMREALDDVNALRERAGLQRIYALNVDHQAVMEAIKKERRHELFCEWGHRWFDLKRQQDIDEVLRRSKPGWESYAQFLPIPMAEILTNNLLVQNPGY